MLRFNGLKITAFKDLIQASGILFLASVFGNLCGLLFWLFMVRRLEPIEYGILNTLFSLFMILSLPASTIQTVVTKSVAQFFGRGEYAQIRCFLKHFGKRIIWFGILSLAVFIVLTPAIGSFLKIDSLALIAITGLILFIAIVFPLTIGVLQGAQRFLAMSINSVFNAMLKLILGITFVVLGFKVMGALVGFGLAALLALMLSIFQFPKELSRAKDGNLEDLHINSVYKYSVPVFFSLLGWMVLTNSDVILVKHFFSPQEAGFYSVAQMVGKIILFLPGVIGVVLFPKMSEAFGQQKTALGLLKKGLLITGFLCIAASILCSFVPGLVLKVLTRKETGEAVKLVPLFCIAMTFYALVQQFINYNLAIHRFRFTIYLMLAAFFQLSLISWFHPDLSTVVIFLIFNSLWLFFIGLMDALKGKEKYEEYPAKGFGNYTLP